MRKNILTLTFFILYICLQAQSNTGLISGPMLGQIEMRTATIWLEVSSTVKSVSIQYSSTDNSNMDYGSASGTVQYNGKLGNDFNPIKIHLNGLKLNTTYQYKLIIDGKEISLAYPTAFTTKDLWQWRKPVPDFSFVTGSCAYFNEPLYDRPGKPYGGDSSIFSTIAKSNAHFMVWLGDNWYTREADYLSDWGLWYRASHDRSLPVLQPLWAAMPHYAIWDDHDYGPNNMGFSYILKEASQKVFNSYWCNPSSGMNGKGIYTKISYGDADIFLLDNRWFRSADETPDSINGKPNAEKHMWGKEQLQWLKDQLIISQNENNRVRASFRIIATGSQVLNQLNPWDCARHYPVEYQELMDFINEYKIEGVIFLTGDRHHSEIIKQERPNNYTLYDVTASPFTAGIAKPSKEEVNHPFRVNNTLVEEQNFAKFSFSGKKGERKLTVQFIGIKGNVLAEWSVSEAELKNK